MGLLSNMYLVCVWEGMTAARSQRLRGKKTSRECRDPNTTSCAILCQKYLGHDNLQAPRSLACIHLCLKRSVDCFPYHRPASPPPRCTPKIIKKQKRTGFLDVHYDFVSLRRNQLLSPIHQLNLFNRHAKGASSGLQREMLEQDRRFSDT